MPIVEEKKKGLSNLSFIQKKKKLYQRLHEAGGQRRDGLQTDLKKKL